MGILNRKGAWVALILGSALLASASVLAYVPPSEFIVQNIIKKRTGLKSVRIKSHVAAFTGQNSIGVSFRETTWVDYPNRRMRSVAYGDGGVELYTISRKLHELPLGGQVLLENNAQSFSKTLINVGVPVLQQEELLSMKDETARRRAELTSLDRWKGMPSWVIGPKNTTPQLWVQKDAFLPNRLFIESSGTQWDLSYQDYKQSTALAYPKIIEGNYYRVELNELGTAIDPKEMALFREQASQGFTEAGNSADSSLRELIERYYRILR